MIENYFQIQLDWTQEVTTVGRARNRKRDKANKSVESMCISNPFAYSLDVACLICALGNNRTTKCLWDNWSSPSTCSGLFSGDNTCLPSCPFLLPKHPLHAQAGSLLDLQLMDCTAAPGEKRTYTRSHVVSGMVTTWPWIWHSSCITRLQESFLKSNIVYKNAILVKVTCSWAFCATLPAKRFCRGLVSTRESCTPSERKPMQPRSQHDPRPPQPHHKALHRTMSPRAPPILCWTPWSQSKSQSTQSNTDSQSFLLKFSNLQQVQLLGKVNHWPEMYHPRTVMGVAET